MIQSINIQFLKNTLVNNKLTDELIYQSVKKDSALFSAIEETLKGKEIKMPTGLSFTDKDGSIRSEIRTKWWENPATMTYKSISVIPLENLPDAPIATIDLS